MVIIIAACEFSLAHVVMEFVDLRLAAIVILVNDLIVKRQPELRLNLLTQHPHNIR